MTFFKYLFYNYYKFLPRLGIIMVGMDTIRMIVFPFLLYFFGGVMLIVFFFDAKMRVFPFLPLCLLPCRYIFSSITISSTREKKENYCKNVKFVSRKYLLYGQYKINRRPREKLVFDSPKKRFFLFLEKKSCIGELTPPTSSGGIIIMIFQPKYISL